MITHDSSLNHNSYINTELATSMMSPHTVYKHKQVFLAPKKKRCGRNNPHKRNTINKKKPRR
jgi:hypothetical protein